MNRRWTDTLTTHPGPAALLALVLAAAASAGMATAILGDVAGHRVLYYVVVFGLIVAGFIVTITRSEPLRFAYLALILCFPIAIAAVPPGRYNLTIFDVASTALAIVLIGKRALGARSEARPIFPTGSLLIAWFLAVPCVVFSQFPMLSAQSFVLTFALYALFLFTLDELEREKGLERLVLVFSVALIMLAIGCFVERLLHVNLSLRGSNLNQWMHAYRFDIYRAGGFFQDPQKAGAYFACMITFLLVLGVRGRFRDGKLRFLVWTAIVLGLGALLTTVSRAAIAACLAASAMAFFAFNKWNAGVKLLVTAGGIATALAITLMPVETWMNLAPAAVVERFQHSRAELEHRITIWFDTWNMFADHPLTGIGFSSFQFYLLKTQPTVFNYYGLGDAQGVIYIPDQPESGYLKILYEGGIAGALAVLLVVGDALRRAIGVIAGHADADARTETIAALTALLAFALTFVTLFTVADQRVAALVAFLFAVVWHHSLRGAPAAQKA